MNDLKFAFRQLLKNPGFAALAVLSLALGISANTTVFSFVNALLLQPPPVEKPSELKQVWRHNTKASSVLSAYSGLSYPGYLALRDQTRSFRILGAYDPEPPLVSWNRDGVGQTIQCQFVSGNFFQVCGLKLPLGRPFSGEEDVQPGRNPVAIISYAFWKTAFNQDAQIVGRNLSVNGVDLVVVGVAPAEFSGLMAGVSPDVWAPLAMGPLVTHDRDWLNHRGAFQFLGLGRLKDDVSPHRAAAELSTLMQQFDKAEGVDRGEVAAALLPSTMIPAPFRGFVGAFTSVLMGAVFMVLLIACANSANLLFARAVSRRQELAIRASVGASKWRLIRQALVESILLALLAGAAGLWLAKLLLPLLLQLTPPTLPIKPVVPMGGTVVLFTILLSLLAGLIFGLGPAWFGARVNLVSTMKDATPAAGSRGSRFTNCLIVGQLAICLLLLVGSTLCIRSLLNAQNVPLGFRVEDRITAELNLKNYDYTIEQRAQFNERFIEKIRQLPEVQSASLANDLPLEARWLTIGVNTEKRQPPPGEEGFSVQTFNVGPNFFATMGTAILQGREFTDADRTGAPEVVVVNEKMAQEFWPGESPIGQRLYEGKRGTGKSWEVVGVVQTGKYRTLGENPRAIFYRSFLQEAHPRSTLVAHVRGNTRGTLEAIRAIVREIDPRLALSRLGTLEEHLAFALFPARTTGLIFAVLGAVALLLAISGLFGVIAYSISRRTREIGVRMALGARRSVVLAMVLRQGMKLAAIGILLGLVGAFVLTRMLQSLLYGITPTDPLTFIVVPLLLGLVAIFACWVPARRASRLHPMEALRYE